METVQLYQQKRLIIFESFVLIYFEKLKTEMKDNKSSGNITSYEFSLSLMILWDTSSQVSCLILISTCLRFLLLFEKTLLQSIYKIRMYNIFNIFNLGQKRLMVNCQFQIMLEFDNSGRAVPNWVEPSCPKLQQIL